MFSFEVQQANGFSPLSTLASATDAQVAAPGLSLSIDRDFAPGIIARNEFGPFGWGWSDSWDTSISVDSDGSVNVLGPDGSLRRFQPDSRGGYFDQPGDYGTLAALPGGGYTLTELDGQVTAYNPDGTLNYIQDTNGNRITTSYTDGLLTKLTHSSGQFLLLAYNNAGLISSITDSDGRTTTYHYDPTDQYLTSVVDFNGQTTSYTYDTGANAATAHALLSVTNSDGTHDYYTYNSVGQLSDAHRDGGSEDTIFSYSEGQVVVADALGDATTYSFDNRGLLLQVQNPLGDTVHYSYDSNLNLIQTTDAAGQVYTNTYDNYGNVLTSTDPLGHTVSYTYDCTYDTLASVTDPNGNTTNYAYDGKANLTSTTYPDGTVESVAYDPIGNVLSSTDPLGQTTQYTYDAAGDILTETFADGSENVFTYDSHQNLTSATDASGTTILTYNPSDELVQITYPGGHYLKYSYDQAGRRIAMVDDTGFTVNYAYDAAGNLSALTDGSGNLIAQYTYDAAGRLSREDDGNGTYTIYTYDAAGELLDVVNYAPDGTINSRFDDTFDSLGRLITKATLDGTWTFTYDAVGELTHAVFVSTNPQVADEDLAYSYDAAGNRTQTVINGVTTDYTTNNMNEYTQVGDAQYSYNADGDVTSISDAGGTTNYSYNANDQLVAETSPSGSWTFQYDAFGNRAGETDNGQTTQFLFDPSGDLLAAYGGNGSSVAHYTYGLGSGPINEVMQGGTEYYYAYCSSGNTMGLTNAAGVQIQTYNYDPFGNSLGSSGSVFNLFTVGGQEGAITNSDGTVSTPSGDDHTDLGRPEDKSEFEIGPILATIFDVVSNGLDAIGKEVSLISNAEPFVSIYSIYHAYGEGPANVAFTLTTYLAGIASFITKSDANLVAERAVTVSTRYALVNARILTIEAPFIESVSVSAILPYSETILDAALLADAAFLDVAAARYALAALAIIGAEQLYNYIANYVKVIYVDSCTAVNSHDPNDKVGPAGYGPQNFVSAANPLPYRVDFENSPTATAPAQRVDVTDQLDPNLDWSTFQWTSFGFGDNVITIPPNTQNYETTVPMTYNGVTFRVVIDLNLNPLTGVLDASFQSLNAANMMTGLATCPGTLSLGPANPEAELPPPVTIGFLPPEDGTGRGMGFITYTVQPKASVPTGTQIRNVADVTFDLGNTIATDQVSDTDPTLGVDPTRQALVTIDSVAPTSSVASLPALSSTNAFTVNWSGTDDAGGSGLASYTIFVSNDGGPFVPWLTNTTDTSASYVGLDGHTYGFFSIATDNVGNQETIKTAPEASTTVDVAPPTSSVTALPPFSPASFTLAWSGTDTNGIGIASYNIYVSDNGGAFQPLLIGTTATSTTLTGSNGHTYGFYSVATDDLGNQQPAQGSAQASTTVDSAAPTSLRRRVATLQPADVHNQLVRQRQSRWLRTGQLLCLRFGQWSRLCPIDHRHHADNHELHRSRRPSLRFLQRGDGQRRQRRANAEFPRSHDTSRRHTPDQHRQLAPRDDDVHKHHRLGHRFRSGTRRRHTIRCRIIRHLRLDQRWGPHTLHDRPSLQPNNNVHRPGREHLRLLQRRDRQRRQHPGDPHRRGGNRPDPPSNESRLRFFRHTQPAQQHGLHHQYLAERGDHRRLLHNHRPDAHRQRRP